MGSPSNWRLCILHFKDYSIAGADRDNSKKKSDLDHVGISIEFGKN